MKKRNPKTIKLNKRLISTLSITAVLGGRHREPLKPGSEISYCNVGSHIECCA